MAVCRVTYYLYWYSNWRCIIYVEISNDCTGSGGAGPAPQQAATPYTISRLYDGSKSEVKNW